MNSYDSGCNQQLLSPSMNRSFIFLLESTACYFCKRETSVGSLLIKISTWLFVGKVMFQRFFHLMLSYIRKLHSSLRLSPWSFFGSLNKITDFSWFQHWQMLYMLVIWVMQRSSLIKTFKSRCCIIITYRNYIFNWLVVVFIKCQEMVKNGK